MAQILVVDDDEGVRSFLAETLELDGHEVASAGDGAEALATLAKRSFDVVVTDLTMPGVDGLTLLGRVRDETPETEVLVLTAFGSIESAVAAMRLGAFDYLQKPLGSPSDLRFAVDRALERRALVARKEQATRERSLPRLGHGSPAMARVDEALRKVAPTQASVLLLGESGVGKEIAARSLHERSARAAGPFVAVNCAALSATLLESELFGHEKGAFTGAVAQRRGRIELASGGTFFLDEIGEMSPELQAKLLRVLETRTYERVGGTRTIHADVRWVAATHRDLEAMIAEGRFRADLYHRLAVFPVRIPPLRERAEDLLPLARELLASIAEELGRPGITLRDDAERMLRGMAFPGNVRQLRNTLERAAILSERDRIDATALAPDHPLAVATPAGGGTTLPTLALDALERMAIEAALAKHEGNRKRAAEELGLGLRTLYEKLKKLGLESA